MLAGSEKAGRADPCYKGEQRGAESPTRCEGSSTRAVRAEGDNPGTESRFVGARAWGAKWGVSAEGRGFCLGRWNVLEVSGADNCDNSENVPNTTECTLETVSFVFEEGSGSSEGPAHS